MVVMPATAARLGTSRRTTSARAVPNSGTDASSGLVRAAPSSFWLRFRSVQPPRKWTRPARPKYTTAAAGICPGVTPRSPSTSATSTNELTRSWRKVDSSTSMSTSVPRFTAWNTP